MKIRFRENRTVQAVDGPTYEAGRIYDLPEASCRHWLNRGVAVCVADVPAESAAAGPAPETAAAPTPTKRTRKR